MNTSILILIDILNSLGVIGLILGLIAALIYEQNRELAKKYFTISFILISICILTPSIKTIEKINEIELKQSNLEKLNKLEKEIKNLKLLCKGYKNEKN